MGFLTGKTLLLTGGGRSVLGNGKAGSIGYGIAVAYAKEGANIAITGRNMKKLEDAKEELERLYGVKVLPIQADISAGADNAAIAADVVKKTIEAFGRIDVLINAAQASASGVSLKDHTTEQFDLAIYSGEDVLTYPIISMGGKGVISVFSNVLPREMHEFTKAALEGRTEEARSMMFRYVDLMNALFMDVNPIPVKAAMNMMGFACGHCRLPLVDMTDDMLAKLRVALAKHVELA